MNQHWKWILFVALRYFKSKRKERKFTPSVLSSAGIAVGVMTLIVVLGVMNGFQLGFIEDILEINSFHLRIYNVDYDDSRISDIKAIDEVKSVLPFMDIHTMVAGSFSGFESCNIRAVPEDAFIRDPGLYRQLGFAENEKTIIDDRKIIIGNELAYKIGAIPDRIVNILSMAGPSFNHLSPSQEEVTIYKVFRSGYYEYDATMGFINFATAELIGTGNEELIIGVKLFNRFADRKAELKIANILSDSGEIVSWRIYNRSFFSALRMEKIVMMLVIGIIFVVVAVNIRHSLERAIWDKKEEIGILRSIGASPLSIRMVFLIDGLLIGFTGATIGSILGLLMTHNINMVFNGFEYIVNMFFAVLSFLAQPVAEYIHPQFTIFSPAYFYMQEIPVRLPFIEFLGIYLFALISSVTAARLASKRISEFKPLEILRNE